MENNINNDDELCGVSSIIQAFQKFLDNVISQKYFFTSNLKNTMESVFESTGYRDKKFNNFSEAKNVLIIHDAGVGDFINCSSSIRAVRQIFPSAHITLSVYPRAKDLAVACPYVDSVFYNERNFNWYDIASMFKWNMEFVKNLLPFKFDFAFCFCAWLSGYLLAYMCGSKNVVAFDQMKLANGFEYSYFLPLINYQIPQNKDAIHSVDSYLSLVEGFINQKIEDRSIEIFTTSRDFESARNILATNNLIDKNLFCICMGGEAIKKHYSPEKYAQLAQKISEYVSDSHFILLGNAKDIESGKIFSHQFNDSTRVLDLTNKVNYRVSAAILSMSQMYIGNDTGTSHLAAGMKIPCLRPDKTPVDQGLNKTTLPRIFYPYGVPSVIVLPITSAEDNINKIEVSKMLEGFYLLQEKIRRNDKTVTYIC